MTKAVYPKGKYTDHICSNILRHSIPLMTFLYHKIIIRALRYHCYLDQSFLYRQHEQYILKANIPIESVTIFSESVIQFSTDRLPLRWLRVLSCIIGTIYILPQLVTRAVYPKSKYTNRVCSNIFRIRYKVSTDGLSLSQIILSVGEM